jgi:hypothetical protein
MKMLDPNWRRGNPPCFLGAIPSWRTRIVPGKLSWYRPYGRCHWIAFFSMAVGVINYPNLDWRFVTGDLHTIPVGYDENRRPRVVMDILLFDSISAEESIALAQLQVGLAPTGGGWEASFEFFLKCMVPVVRASILPRSSKNLHELAGAQKYLAECLSA